MKEKERFEILLEDIKSDNKTTQEGLDFLSRKIDVNTQKIDTLDNKFTFTAIKHNERFDKIEKDIKGIKCDINDMKTDLGGKINRVLNKVENHEDRMILLERKP